MSGSIVLFASIACADLDQAATGSGSADDDATGAGSTGDTPGTSAPADGSEDGPKTGVESGEGSSGGVGSTGMPPALDGTGTTTGVGSSEGDGSSTGDPPVAGLHDGQYAGTMSVTFDARGSRPGSCSGPMNISVVEAAVPQVTGSGTCSTVIDGYPVDVTVQVEGSVVSPAANGTIASVINTIPEDTTWNGSFTGDMMDATFMGDLFVGVPVTYVGDWMIAR